MQTRHPHPSATFNQTGLQPAPTRPDDPRTGLTPGGTTPPYCGEPRCDLNIRIDARGDVNIHHHCGAEAPACEPATPGGSDDCYPPVAPGNTCLPPVAGAKHKRSPAQKLAARAQRSRVPSALAASSLQLVRRHLAGKRAANALEQAAFTRLAGVPAAVRSTLACAIDRFDALPAEQRRLFDLTLANGIDDAIDPGRLSTALGDELVQRAGIVAFGDADATREERPGLVRVFEPGAEDFFTQVRICSVNGLRTQDFIPPIGAGSLRPEEIAKVCTTTLVNGAPQVSCEVRTADCVGGFAAGVCLRVPTIAAGDGVLLQGVNYFSVDAKVRLTPRASASAPIEIDAFVFGDLDTPVSETVDGQTRLINDCRVHDRIGCTLPASLAPAIYDVQVVVPNVTGITAFGPSIVSNPAPIEVTPPPTARFQITGEKLVCHEETSPAFLGSDEVGLRVVAVPLLADLSIGATQLTTRRFDDVDSDESRNINRIFFDQNQPIAAVALAVLGHEVDGEDAYNNMITSVTDIFVDLVKEQAAFVKSALAAAGIGAADIGKLGGTGAIVIGIAVAITLAVDLIIALWAPADLIIEDPTGYTLLELVERTGADFALPDPSSFSTEGDIDVSVTPLEKIPTQYRERREYASDDEDSRYEIVYRFNRVA